VEELKVLGKSDVKDVLRAVSARVLGEDFESQVQLLKNNIATFCATQLPTLPDRCRIAAALTRGLSLNEAEYLTGVAQSSISWGRAEIEAGPPNDTRGNFSFCESGANRGNSPCLY